jgi:hypothetical protein
MNKKLAEWAFEIALRDALLTKANRAFWSELPKSKISGVLPKGQM